MIELFTFILLVEIRYKLDLNWQLSYSFTSQNHRMVEFGRILWRSSCPTVPAQAMNSRPGCPGPHLHVAFEYIQRWETSKYLWATCASAWFALTVKNCFMMFRENLQFQLVPIASGSATEPHWKEPGFLFFTPVLRVFAHIGKIPSLNFLFCMLNSPSSSQPFLTGEVLLRHLSGSSLAVAPYLPCTGKPRSAPSTLGVNTPVLSRGKGSTPSICCQSSS